MRLSTLLAAASARAADAVGDVRAAGLARDPEVTAVVQDHGRATPGALFVARRGARFDGHAFAAAAVAGGAVAVVGDAPAERVAGLGGVPYVRVPDAKRALPHLAAALHGYPSERLRVVGVTGTDGKTTTSFLLAHVLGARRETGLMSTAAVRLGGEELGLEGHFTTPEAPEVQAFLARCAASGATHAVLESSSHGFSQHRLDAVAYAVGVVTNVSPEHLDHHGTFAAYVDAKATLVRRAATAVLNRDDAGLDAFAAAAGEAGARVVTYGQSPGVDARLLRVAEPRGALELTLDLLGERVVARLPMVGRYNAWNAAAALATAVLEGVPADAAAAALASFPGVPGRMQVIATTPFTVIVDFAHTPPALAKALAAVRRPGARTLVVVGSAGERDPGKRAPLGEAAVRGADVAVLTEEDSRSEDVSAILAAMARGAEAAGGVRGETFHLEPDRREAIALAYRLARPGDVVVLAGKGHERTLERADETVPWDEAATARELLPPGAA
ncbi:MAG TPA: UDP-N-acetylmuramyl-tripeptide synthetase [Trueperaceae bacterium]|nr:UDP-N-acetylmuramyl-tripeptide synthetase [Trueperaceae bacterium]